MPHEMCIISNQKSVEFDFPQITVWECGVPFKSRITPDTSHSIHTDRYTESEAPKLAKYWLSDYAPLMALSLRWEYQLVCKAHWKLALLFFPLFEVLKQTPLADHFFIKTATVWLNWGQTVPRRELQTGDSSLWWHNQTSHCALWVWEFCYL